MKFQVLQCLLPTIAVLMISSNAEAQPHHSRNRSTHGNMNMHSSRRTSGYQFNGNSQAGSHAVRDRYGYSYGTYRQNVIRPSYQYIVPHNGTRHNGTYYQNNGSYYYYPQTYNDRADQHSNTRPQQVAFGSFSRTEDLGSRLETIANDFCLELDANYRRNRNFDEVYREAYQILQTAKYIHKEDHDRHRTEIAREVSKLDDLFHHVQDEVSQWRSDRDHHNPSMGIQSHLGLLESTIHHLMNDAGVRPRHDKASGDGHGDGHSDGHGQSQTPSSRPRIAPAP